MYMLSLLTPDKKVFDKTVNNILNQHKYRGLQGKKTNWVQETVDKFERMMESLLSNNSQIESQQIQPVPSAINMVLIILGAILSIIFIVTIIILVKKSFKKERRLKTILGETIDEMTTVESLYQRVLEYEKEENYREAIRFGFIRLLFQMNESNIIYLDEAMTNNELINTLKNKKFSHTQEFEELVFKFNETWYGHKKLDGNEYSKWQEIMTSLWNEVHDFEGSK